MPPPPIQSLPCDGTAPGGPLISGALFKSRPQCPDDAKPNILVGHVEAVFSSRYALARASVTGNRLLPCPPMGWRPDATLPLEKSLPYPWAAEVHPDASLLWQNAIALRRAWERGGRTKARGAIKEIAHQLIEKIREHTEHDGPAAFLTQHHSDPENPTSPPTPWVGAVANAHAVLAWHERGQRRLEKGGRNVREWFAARNHFAIMFEDRFNA